MVAVFIDGCFWHQCPEHGRIPETNSDYWREKLDRNSLRDRRNSQILLDAGWLVLRYWEHESAMDVTEDIRKNLLGWHNLIRGV